MDMPVPAFAEQVQVEIGELRRETVGVDDGMAIAVAVFPNQAIVSGKGFALGQAVLKQVGAFHPLQPRTVFAKPHISGAGNQDVQHFAVGPAMQTEHGERIVVARFEDLPQSGIQAGSGSGGAR